jgi:Galactose oxidase, central domain/Bacterial Ig domain
MAMRAWCILFLVAGCGGAEIDGSAQNGTDSGFRRRGAADGGMKSSGGSGGTSGGTSGGMGGGTSGGSSGGAHDGGAAPLDGGTDGGGGGGGSGGSTGSPGGAACGMTVAGGAGDRLKLPQARITPTDPAQIDAIADQAFWSSLAWDSGRGELILFGGQTHDQKAVQTWKWDGTAFSVVATADKSPPARSQFAMVYDSGRGRIVLFGGATTSGVLGDLWEWDGAKWNQILFKSGPSARARHSMAYDSLRKRVVLFGGGDGNADLADTWEWDGVNWTGTLAATNGPPARQYAGMAFDPATQRTVLVGGEAWSYGKGSSPLDGTTWEWDGSAWSKAATSSARGGAHVVLVDEPLLGGLVMYGGTIWDEYTAAGGFSAQRPDIEAGDFWLWKSRSWTQLANRGGTAPEVNGYLYFPDNTNVSELGPESYHWGAAWDDCRQRLVMFRHGWDSGDLWIAEIGDGWSPDSAPVFTNPPQAQQVNPQLQLRLSLSASDPDADPLTWTTGALPAGAGFSITTTGASFIWSPTAAQLGDYSVDFFVSDGTDTTKWTVPIHVGDITYAGFANGSFSQSGSAMLTVDELVSQFDDAGDWLWYDNGPTRSAYASCTLSGNNPGVLTLACSMTIAQTVGAYNGSATGIVPQSEILMQDVTGPDFNGFWQVTLQPQGDGSTLAQLTQGGYYLRRTDKLAWQNGTVSLTLK